jgi:hypothetical protein
MNQARRPLRLILCLLPGFAATAWAGGPMVIAPPVINLQPHNPVLDQQCVDRLKGSGASTARAAHECRKAREPGTPVSPALKGQDPTSVSPSSPKP